MRTTNALKLTTCWSIKVLSMCTGSISFTLRDLRERNNMGPNVQIKQECIPVGCVLPAAVAVQGGLHQVPPRPSTPQDQTPSPTRNPPPGTRLPQNQASPKTRSPWDQTPPPTRHPSGTRHPPVDRHTCKHITLPQTSVAGGNNLKMV